MPVGYRANVYTTLPVLQPLFQVLSFLFFVSFHVHNYLLRMVPIVILILQMSKLSLK